MPNDKDHARITRELVGIASKIEEITGLKTNWNGELLLDPTTRARGFKPFRCEIVLRADLVEEDIRWRTLIHESFHAVSRGYNFPDFSSNRGWEEGVIEQLQRLFRPRILSALSVRVNEALFLTVEQDHLFNIYIEALERIRTGSDAESHEFYIQLLRVPIKQRYASLQAQVTALNGSECTRRVRILAEANAILNKETIELNYANDPERQCLLTQVLDATTLPEIETATQALDCWMAAHPDDAGMEDGYEQLALLKDGLLAERSHAVTT